MVKPIISGIVSNYNGRELGLLDDFYKAFLKDDFQRFELILVDNASTDNSASHVEKHFGGDRRVKVVRNPVNMLSSGINLGYEISEGKYILFLNNDIYFKKGALKHMVNFMESHPKVGLVQGKMVSYYDHKKIDSVGETMDIYGNPVTLGAKEDDAGQYDSDMEVLSVSGAASLLKSSLVNKIGLTDSDFGIGYEDMDLALRVRLAGYKVFYFPKALIYHRRAASTSVLSPEIKTRMKFHFNKNRLATIIKNYELYNVVKSLPVVILIYVGTGLFEIFYKRLWRFGLSRFLAIGWVVIGLPKLLSKRNKVQRNRKLSDAEALLPFMAKGRLMDGFKGFLGSKKW